MYILDSIIKKETIEEKRNHKRKIYFYIGMNKRRK